MPYELALYAAAAWVITFKYEEGCDPRGVITRPLPVLKDNNATALEVLKSAAPRKVEKKKALLKKGKSSNLQVDRERRQRGRRTGLAPNWLEHKQNVSSRMARQDIPLFTRG